MKTNQTYSLDTLVVEEFNARVESQKRSNTIEDLLVDFLKTKRGDEV